MNFKRPNIETVTMVIDPQVAQEMLETNENNRNVRKGNVNSLVAAMKRGSFRLSPQGISFDRDGKLIDGQHRLLAVVQSGCTVQMRVTMGCERDVFKVLDSGKNRNADDLRVQDGIDWLTPRVMSIHKHILNQCSYAHYCLQTEDVVTTALANEHFLRVADSVLELSNATNSKHSHPRPNMYETACMAECLLYDRDVVAVKEFYEMYRFGRLATDRNNNIVMSLKMSNHADRAEFRKRLMNAYINFRDNTTVQNARSTAAPAFKSSYQAYVTGEHNEYFKTRWFEDE